MSVRLLRRFWVLRFYGREALRRVEVEMTWLASWEAEFPANQTGFLASAITVTVFTVPNHVYLRQGEVNDKSVSITMCATGLFDGAVSFQALLYSDQLRL